MFTYCAPPEYQPAIAVVLDDTRSWEPAIVDCDHPDVVFTVVVGSTFLCGNERAVGCTTTEAGHPAWIRVVAPLVGFPAVVEHELGHALYHLDHSSPGIMTGHALWPTDADRLLAL